MSVDWPQPLSLPPQNIKLVDCDTFTQQRGATPDLVTTNVRPPLTQYLLASNPYMLHTTHTTRPRSLETPSSRYVGQETHQVHADVVGGEARWKVKSVDIYEDTHWMWDTVPGWSFPRRCIGMSVRCCDAHHLFITRAVLNKQVMFLQVVIPSARNVTFSLSLI